jgi:hypothetical protein
MEMSEGYKFTEKDARVVGGWLAEVEMTLKIIATALIALATAAFIALGYWVFV